jgi:hypothetical protein
MSRHAGCDDVDVLRWSPVIRADSAGYWRWPPWGATSGR